MFDIGFSELVVIGVVALIVIGPERLPRVARTIGILAGRLQRYVADVKADINREVELDELRKMRDSVQQAATDIKSSFDAEVSKTEDGLNRAIEGKPEKETEPPETIAPDAKPPETNPPSTEPAALPSADASKPAETRT
ncbi:MAG: Sec-independent protein translocase subunit TatB [Betaproteobacteria bacterium]|nr:Sec-independent protein translocase subunit TatB [Betaproteobacteria bacterium]